MSCGTIPGSHCRLASSRGALAGWSAPRIAPSAPQVSAICGRFFRLKSSAIASALTRVSSAHWRYSWARSLITDVRGSSLRKDLCQTMIEWKSGRFGPRPTTTPGARARRSRSAPLDDMGCSNTLRRELRHRGSPFVREAASRAATGHPTPSRRCPGSAEPIACSSRHSSPASSRRILR